MITLSLSKLEAAPGSRKRRKIVGRGIGSGHGKTSGKGHKGQNARSGGGTHPWFEGGQMPLQRRLPKRGFNNIFRKEFEIINLSQLAKFKETGPITPEVMKAKGLIGKLGAVKILGNGDISAPLIVHAHKFSRTAVEKIEKSGGKAVVL